MPHDSFLQKFYQFKAMVISADIPTGLLLDMLENFILSDSRNTDVIEAIPILDGQLSLSDLINDEELIPV